MTATKAGVSLGRRPISVPIRVNVEEKPRRLKPTKRGMRKGPELPYDSGRRRSEAIEIIGPDMDFTAALAEYQMGF